MDVVLYMRYSSERQNEQSIEGQQRICTKFCEQYGYNIVDVYIDRALSAFHDTCKRVEFQRMITDSEKRQWQGIVVYKLDRFARNRYDSATYKAKLKKNGVRVISATENISDNPEGVLLESVLEGMAEFYSKELSQKITRGMYESAHKCQNIGGVIPLGYKIVDKKLAIDPLTAPIVQEAFRRYADGETVAEICESFNNRGFKTSRGASFNKNSFKSMFKNVRYIGTYTYKDFQVENAVPAIIDRETFETVQRRLRANEQAPAKAKAVVDYILSSKLFCGHCSRPMTGEYGTGRNGKHYYYACSGRKRFKDCTKQNVRKDAIEYTVAKAAMELLNDETIEYYADLAMKANEEEMKNSTLIPSLEQKIKEIDQSIVRLLRMVEQGAESHALTERLNELEKEKRATEKRLLKEKSTIIELDREMVVYWLSQFTKGDIDNPEFRRHIVDMLVNSVYVYDSPDGPPELDIGFNLTSGKHARVTLEECRSGSDLSSYAPPLEYYPNRISYIVRKKVLIVRVKMPSR